MSQEAIINGTLEELQAAANKGPLRNLLQSHLIQHCTTEKLQAFHKLNEKHKKLVVSHVALNMAIEMFDNLGRELAAELKKATSHRMISMRFRELKADLNTYL
ncbi:hypothetical protein ASPFODRAFT_202649 [Aspergillus luchuensis CBS 106.47]|uniref:Uncharacterized protein n=1 Tax=Aspergillus luchuensis (strain CBS 106.47) TaxID=1137211 RepID=A0A1M3U1K8_ASPLC|nr:hypothetical protein ASPFODRAFT_202649 [Aspergillus luchuensis CBS 106.47]